MPLCIGLGFVSLYVKINHLYSSWSGTRQTLALRSILRSLNTIVDIKIPS